MPINNTLNNTGIKGLIPAPKNNNAMFSSGTISPTGQVSLGTQVPKTPAPVVNKPTTQVQNPPVNSYELNNLQNQLANKQNELGQAQNAGYAGNQPIQKDASGNILPAPTTTKPYNAGTSYGQYTSALANVPTSNTDVQTARKNLQDLQNKYAETSSQIQGAPGLGLSEAGGQQGIENQLYSTKEAAAQTALQSALQSQGLQQQALGQAAGLAAPQQANALGFYSPTTGEFTPYGGGENTGTGAFNAGQIGGQVNLGTQYAQVLQPAYTKAGAIKEDLKNFIQSKNFNPSTFNLANFAQNWLKNQVSDVNQQAFSQYLNEFLNTLSPLVGVTGGTVTDFKQQLVNNMLNSSAQGQSLSQAVDNLYNVAGQTMNSVLKSGQGQGATPPANPKMIGGENQGLTFGSFFGQ